MIRRPASRHRPTAGGGRSLHRFLRTLLVAVAALMGAAGAAHAEGGTLAGSVTDDFGRPLAGIQVVAIDGDRRMQPITSAPDGTFVIAVPVGRWKLVFTDPAGIYAGEAFPDAFLLEDAQTLVVFEGTSHLGVLAELELGARMMGRVVDGAGRPVPEAYLAISLNGRPAIGGTADAAGAFDLSLLPSGRWTIRGMGPSGSPYGIGDVAFDLVPGQVESNVLITLGPKFSDLPAPAPTPNGTGSSLGPQSPGGAPPAETAPILVVPTTKRLAVSRSWRLIRDVRCQERSRCASVVTVVTSAAVRTGKGRKKTRPVVARGVIDTRAIESRFTLRITAAGRSLLRRSPKGLKVKVVSRPSAPGAVVSSFRTTLVAPRR